MNKLIKEARRSLGPFCFSECHAFCCRKGNLTLSLLQMNKVVQKEGQALLDNGRLTLKKGKFTLNLKGDCPSLKDNKCTIHNSPSRPKVCDEFPLFVREQNGKTYIFATPCCPAVQAGKLYPFLRLLKAKGCIIVEPGEFNNFEGTVLPKEKK